MIEIINGREPSKKIQVKELKPGQMGIDAIGNIHYRNLVGDFFTLIRTSYSEIFIDPFLPGTVVKIISEV